MEARGLVCVTPHVPDPDAQHAGGVQLHHRLTLLSQHLPVSVIAPSTPENEDALHISTSPFPTRLVRPDPSRQGARALFKLGPALAGDLDVFATTIHRALATDDSLSSQLRQAAVIEVQWGEYAPLLPALRRLAPDAVLSLFLHDVMASVRRSRSEHHNVRLQERLVYRASRRISERREARLYTVADLIVVLGLADRDVLRRLGVPNHVHVAQPWVHIPARPIRPASEPVVLFVAALWREENATAVEWLLTHVWPLVRQRVPTARLRVVGPGAPARLGPLVARSAGVELTGFVTDLDIEYERARVAVAPLTDPSGLKIKVAQSMAVGLPVVMRPAALAGLSDAPTDALGAVTDSPTEFADAIVRLLVVPGEAERVGRAAADWAQSRFSPEKDVAEFLQFALEHR